MPAGAPKGYYESLGGATYTLAIDSSSLELGLTAAQKKVEAASTRIKKSLQEVEETSRAHGRGAAQGLLALGQAVDDMQYGFKAIVNNIPQVVYMMGGGAGIAGAVGIAGVAVNQLINHWEELARLWGDTTGDTLPKLKQGIEGLSASLKEIHSQIESLKRTGKEGPNLFEIITGSGIKGEQKLENLKDLGKAAKEQLQVAKDMASLEKTTEEEETGAAFRKGVKGAKGGLNALMDILTDRGFDKRTAQIAISGAAQGNVGFLEDILGKLSGDERSGGFKGIQQAHPAARKEEAERKIDEQAADVERELNEKDRKKKAEIEKNARLAALQDQEEALREKEHHIRFAAQMRKGDNAAYGSTKAMLADIHQGAYDAGATVGKNQLKRLEMIHLELVKLREQEKQLKRGANFQ